MANVHLQMRPADICRLKSTFFYINEEKKISISIKCGRFFNVDENRRGKMSDKNGLYLFSTLSFARWLDAAGSMWMCARERSNSFSQNEIDRSLLLLLLLFSRWILSSLNTLYMALDSVHNILRSIIIESLLIINERCEKGVEWTKDATIDKKHETRRSV